MSDVKLSDVETLTQLHQAASKIREQLGKVIVGQNDVLDQMLVALFANSHALLVGVPGLAKTLLVASLAKTLDLSFGRVQFTPDLLPADITGTDILFEIDGSRRLQFSKGPIFHHLILADEINRTPPKTQSALLEAMQEHKVTVGNNTHVLPEPFLVFATRNPIEQEGTYILPEAQLDRFLLEVHLNYPSEQEEIQIARKRVASPPSSLEKVVKIEDLVQWMNLIPRIPITEEALAWSVNLVRSSRPNEKKTLPEVAQYVRFGAGPRGSQALVHASRARAALLGKPVADLDDVRAMALPTLRHRLVLSFRAEAEKISDEDIVKTIIKSVS